MWRKTRSIQSGSSCIGSDPNRFDYYLPIQDKEMYSYPVFPRNFGFMFGGEGTSRNPCSEIYKGTSAFSEPETAAVRDFVHAIEASGATLYAYLTFHAYSQVWLLPWGYTVGTYPKDYNEQLSLGQASIAALRKVHGTVYETGQGADLLCKLGLQITQLLVFVLLNT